MMTISNVTVHGSNYGFYAELYMYQYELIEDLQLSIMDSQFTSNRIGIFLDPYRYYYSENDLQPILVNIERCSFLENGEAVNVNLGSYSNRHEVQLHLADSTFDHNDKCVTALHSSNSFDMFAFSISGNTFVNTTSDGHVLKVKGSGTFRNNTVTSSYTHNFDVISVSHESARDDCLLSFQDNRLLDNLPRMSLLSVDTKCSFDFTNNIVTGNTGDNYAPLLRVFTRQPSSADDESRSRFTNNLIKENAISQDQFVTAAVAWRGTSVPDITGNVFSNPTFDAEIYFYFPSVSDSFEVNFTRNYFGFASHAESVRRVRQAGFSAGVFTAHVDVNPFYTSEDLDEMSSGSYDGTQALFDATSSLSGLLKTSLSLLPNQEYHVTSDFVIGSDVILTMSAGTQLTLVGASSVLAQGQLEVDASSDNPARCVAEANVSSSIPTRFLYGNTPNEGRLQILEGEEWGYICDVTFDMNAAAVMCRQMQLGTGKTRHSINYITQSNVHSNTCTCAERLNLSLQSSASGITAPPTRCGRTTCSVPVESRTSGSVCGYMTPPALATCTFTAPVLTRTPAASCTWRVMTFHGSSTWSSME